MNNNPNNGGYEASNEAIDFESTPAKSNGGQVFAIISLITGILPFIGCNLCGVSNIAAIIFAIIAKKQGSKSPMATIGLILGIISLAFAVLAVIGVILYYVFMFVMGMGIGILGSI